MRKDSRLNPASRRWLGETSRPAFETLESRTMLTTVPTGFSQTLVASGFGSPSAFDVTQDGRVLVAVQTGDVRVIRHGVLLPTPFVHLTVDSNGERGLLGVVEDPNFASNHFVYVYHTVPAAGAAAPFNEISRFTADPANPDVALASSQVDILKLNDLSGATNHNGGAMHFGTDGMLYVGVGENANPANSQTLSNLLGKVLRIDVSKIQPGDPINDAAKLVPAGNPFISSTNGLINGAIYALGFRNPFSFAVQPGTGTIYINDVGQDTWEEIDLLTAGRNYGWNKSEGFANPNPPAGLGPGAYQDPLLAYNHSGGPSGGGVAIVGGTFYNPPAGVANPFPASFVGKYFYEDVGKDFIRVFDPANPGSLATPDTSSAFATATEGAPVDMAVAPDGGIYYLARVNGGELMEISFTNTSVPTITTQPASQTAAAGGDAAFNVSASGPGTLRYQWQRNDGPAGAFADIAGATFVGFTLRGAQSTDKAAQFRVLVSNDNGSVTSDPASLAVVADQAPVPEIKIVSGLRRGLFDAGRAIHFKLSATDAEDGREPASRFTYQVDYVTSLNATPGGVVRPFVQATHGVESAKFTPARVGPYTLTDVLYRITFTVTDASGLSSTVLRELSPNVSRITLKTRPDSLTLNVDGQPTVAPTSFDSVVGFARLLDAPTSQQNIVANYVFASWSDHRPASHSIITHVANTTYTVRYRTILTGG